MRRSRLEKRGVAQEQKDLRAFSTPINHCAENVGVCAIVVSKLKFRDVQRQVLGADLMECADHAALEDRPESLNRVGMDRADNVLIAVVVNRSVRIVLIQSCVSRPRIGRKQANLVRHSLLDEVKNAATINAFQYASDYISFALYCADNRSFVVATVAFFLIPMPVFILAADVGFVNLDNATKLLLWLNHRGADFVRHVQRRFVRAKAQLALNLKRANALFAGRHEMDDLEPFAKRLVRVLEDGPGNDGKTIASIAARSTLRALPVPLARMQVIDGGIATARADNALRPAAGLQVGFASIVVTDWESCLKLPFGHLMDWLRTFCHGDYPISPVLEGYCHG
jgi:hypothetical protein